MSMSLLSIGSSALYAAQRAVETASHNVANANTEGYTRQRLAVTSAIPTPGTPGRPGSGQVGMGVAVVGISRLRDQLADVAYRSEADGAGSTSARAEVLDRAQGILGPFGSGTTSALDRFFGAWSQLSLNPQDPAARQVVLDAGQTVAGNLRDASTELDRIRTDLTARVGGQVDQVNSLADQVATLNLQIADATNSGLQPNDLLDQRDVALDQLSRLTGATSRTTDSGKVDVFLGANTLVRGVTADHLTAASNPPPAGSDFGGDPVIQLNGRPVQVGGSIGGYLQAASVDLRDVERSLDGAANALRDSVNTAHRAGFDLSGNPGGDFFTGVNARNLTLAPGLGSAQLAAAATSAGAPYDGNNAVALADLRNQTTGGATVADRLHGLAGLLGSRADGAQRAADAAESAVTSATALRSSADGVSVDEEMVDIVKFQHAYSAAARIVSIADSMLDTIINGMGAGR